MSSTANAKRIMDAAGGPVKTAIILGSGLGDLADQVMDRVSVPYADLDGFPGGGVSGHASILHVGRVGNNKIAMLAGRSHYYENGQADIMRPAIETLKKAGVETLILTNSAGSLDPDIPPGSVMQIRDHINFSGMNPLIGEPSDARFVGMTEAYDAGLREDMASAARQCEVPLFAGVYMWFSGPSFETPAEIEAARRLGADAVGMSTVPEVILARFFDLNVAAFSVITNYGAGMTGAELSHQETKEVAPLGGKRLGTILTHYLTANSAAD